MALPCYVRFRNAFFYPAEKQGLRWIAHKTRAVLPLKSLWILPMSPIVRIFPGPGMSSFHDSDICRSILESLPSGLCGIDAFDLDQMLDLDLEVHHQDSAAPTAALSTMADSLPRPGDRRRRARRRHHHGRSRRPTRRNWNKVAAALVGTFLGILLCYGLVGPIAANMTKAAEEEHAFLYVMRVLMVSF